MKKYNAITVFFIIIKLVLPTSAALVFPDRKSGFLAVRRWERTRGETRTHTSLRTNDFKSFQATYYCTRASMAIRIGAAPIISSVTGRRINCFPNGPKVGWPGESRHPNYRLTADCFSFTTTGQYYKSNTTKNGAPRWCRPTDSDLQGPYYSRLTIGTNVIWQTLDYSKIYPQFRRLVLYPVELRVHKNVWDGKW